LSESQFTSEGKTLVTAPPCLLLAGKKFLRIQAVGCFGETFWVDRKWEEAVSIELRANEGLAERLLRIAREATSDELPNLIGQLESAKAICWSRLTTPPAQSEHDELLGVTEAARRLGVSEDYLYRHAQEYPFTRRQGRKLLFSAQGIDKQIKQGT
jgi:excisionase family DNA binding protein